MNIGLGFYNLWLILAIVGAFAWLLMEIADKLRGVRIENKEDHRNIKVIVISGLPLLAFLIVTIFTPIVTGTLFWIGCIFLILAGIIYILSIIAFVKDKKGLTVIGIYKISRNPMYVAIFFDFAGFIFMAWQFSPTKGILMMFIVILNIIATHWMVLGEERFLTEKYGDAYREYMNRASRYVGIPKKEL